MFKRFLTTLIIITIIASLSPNVAISASNNNKIRVLIGFNRIPGPSEQALVRRAGGQIKYSYTVAPAIAATVPAQAIQGLSNNPNVAYIEPDIIMQAFGDTSPIIPTGINRINAEGVSIKCESVGIAIIDSGIDIDHPDLNVQDEGIHFYNNGASDNNFDDVYGHGTHVAGTAAAKGVKVVGVAPNARLYGVKVLGDDGYGYMSDIIRGVQWVVDNASALDIQVANLSLGGTGRWSNTFYGALDHPEVIFAIAAGNDSRDIFSSIPSYQVIPAIYGAFLPNVITISALADSDGLPDGKGPDITYHFSDGTTAVDNDDSFAFFSNYSSVRVGDVVLRREVLYNPIAYILPGVGIFSTVPYGDGYEGGWCGTSMATPHAAGLIALGLINGSMVNLEGRPYMGLCDYSDPDGYYEPLPYVNNSTPTENLAPSADFTYSPTGLTVSFDASSSSDPDGDILSYDWDFDDGSTASGVTTSHNFTAGDHSVKLTVTDDEGATGSVTKTIKVTSDPPPSITTDVNISINYLRKEKQYYIYEAIATVYVSNNGLPVPDADVSGTWGGEASGTDSGTTNNDGYVAFTSSVFSSRSRNPVVTFTLN